MKTDPDFDPLWHNVSIPRREWHFHARVLKHYQIRFAPGDFADMLRDIRKGRALKLEDVNSNRAVYAVRVQSAAERIFVIVAKQRHVVTAVPPTARLRLLRQIRCIEAGRVNFRIVVTGSRCEKRDDVDGESS